MKYYVQVAGQELEVSLEAGGVRVAGELFPAVLESLPGTPLRQLRLGERTLVFTVEAMARGDWALAHRGERWEASVVDERTRHIRSLTGGARGARGAGEVKAPMPGLVLRVLVEPGQRVEAGAALAVLEAMKMENQIKAPMAGVIERIHVGPGTAVEKGQILVVLAPAEGGGTGESGVA
jgi:biotin carboxyl carrier protein